MLGPETTDQTGIYGSLLHYALIFLFMGGALTVFIYLWRKGRLDMDEEPKMQMMNDDEKITKDEQDDKSNS